MPDLTVTFCAYDSPGNLGGPPSWMQRLLPQLRERGIECRVLFLLHHETTGPTMSFLEAEGFICRASPCHETAQERIRWILGELAASPPDVFVPNLVVAAYYAARWVKREGIPTVGILHSDDDFYDAIRERFASGSKRFRLSALVCVSRELEEQSRTIVPSSVDIRRIPYGVPIPPIPRRRDSPGLRLAYVGRLAEEQKRITEQTRAMCRIVREISGTEAVLFGDGPDRGAMETVLANEGRGLPVRWEGHIENHRMQETLLDFDVLVLLSDYEGLPIAVLEAMACGLVPVCLKMRSGIPELVEDGVSGLIVDDRDVSFVAAIRRLQEDPGLWETLSLNARNTIEAQYSSDHCADEWASFLHSLAKSAIPATSIRVPRRFFLPPVHPALSGADPRPPRFRERLRRSLVRTRMFAGKVKGEIMKVGNHESRKS